MSALARIELENGTWPQLLPWLWSLTASPSAAHREVALQTLYMLLDTLAVTPTSPGAGMNNRKCNSIIRIIEKDFRRCRKFRCSNLDC